MKIKIIAIALIVITMGILLYLVTNFTDIFLTENPEDINNAEVIIVEDKKEETNKPNPTDTSKIAYFGGYGKKSSYSNCEQRDFLISLDRNTKK